MSDGADIRPPSCNTHKKGGLYRRYFKRPLDFVLSLGAIILSSPLSLIIVLLVRIKLGSPVIFKQERAGLNEKVFTIYKFRTMTNEKMIKVSYCQMKCG